MLGEAELELLRGLSKDTLAAILQLVVAAPCKKMLNVTKLADPLRPPVGPAVVLPGRPSIPVILPGLPNFIHHLASNTGMFGRQASAKLLADTHQPLLPDTQQPCQLEPVPTTGADVLLRFPCCATQPAHSLILRLASPLLAEQLASAGCTAGEGGDVVLELDTDAAMFRRLLQFLYPVSPRPQLTVHEAAHLYPLCCKYNCVGLMEACRQVLEGPELAFLLGSSNPLDSPRTWLLACHWLELARGYTLPGLEAQCTEYLHSWSTAKVIPDEQLVSALEGCKTEALMTFAGHTCGPSWKSETSNAMASLAESIKQLMTKRATGQVLFMPLGEPELQQLRGLSQGTLVAVLLAAVAEVPTISWHGPLMALPGPRPL